MEADLTRRFSGLDRLWGPDASERLTQSHVVVVGVGGVGSWSVEALARSGIGRLTLIDFDQVAESNVNRQIHALTETIGMAKVDALERRIESIHPGCQVKVVEDFVTPENIKSVMPLDAHVVIDACDQFSAKLALAHWCFAQGQTLITVGAAGGKTHPEWVRVEDLSAVTHDPLLARLRRDIRSAQQLSPKDRIGITCVFSQEKIRSDQSCAVGEDQQSHDLNCHGYGSFVGVTATFGLVAASCAIQSRLDKKAE